jgi:hypothetical protein
MQSFSLGSDDHKGLSSHCVHGQQPMYERNIARHAALTAYRTFTPEGNLALIFTQKSYRIIGLVCGDG